MQLSDFEYDLPETLIAQEPAAAREDSRMLRVDRTSGTFRDDQFSNFAGCLRSDDVLVLNDTRVFPARLIGTSDTGASVEIFLIDNISDSVWQALARPARRLKTGKRVTFGELTGLIRENRGEGHILIEFSCEGDLDDVLDRVGKTPLPPYIKRADTSEEDRERYQTVYAKTRGAIAAPTAGLHFTENVLSDIRSRGIEIVTVTLHVGYGTFAPVRVDDLSQHRVLPERYELDRSAAQVLNDARAGGRRIVAVGTTTTRMLEASLAKNSEFTAGSGLADLTITPGYEFKGVGALLTNFHLPQSSLLILVSTFAGHELIMRAYRHAVAERYRFYSYGDCMFIE